MWRQGSHFRMPTRTAAIAWVLMIVGAIGIGVILANEKDQSVALAELGILGAGLVGLSIVVFVFDYFVFRDCDPRKRKS